MYETTMPWGKHRGTPLSQVPEDYLQWALREANSMDAWLREEVEEELERRRKERTKGQSRFDEDYNWDFRGGFKGNGNGNNNAGGSTGGSTGNGYGNKNSSGYSSGYSSATRVPSTVDRQTALEIVEAGRRALARKNHPDLGGSNATMAKINTVCDWLEDHLKSVLPDGSAGRR